MKLAVPPRHRRLLALCACSAAIHLVLLEWVAGQGGGARAPDPVGGEELVLRLAPATPSPRAGAAIPPAQPAPTAPAFPAARARPTPVRAAPVGKAASVAGVPAAPDAEQPTPPEPPLPGRYRIRLPASAQLSYTRTLERPGAGVRDAGPARLTWRTDGQHYALRLNGVGGELASEGDRGDAGLLPRSAHEGAAGPQASATLEFDHQGGRVRFASGEEAPALPGIQDRASMLLQLAGMGLAAPEQVEGTVALAVAGGGQATLVRWQVIGDEEVATGIGRLATRHLAEVAAPGRPRLEVWLAPGQDWLPVRLRLVHPDGSVATQTLAGATRDPAEPGG